MTPTNWTEALAPYALGTAENLLIHRLPSGFELASLYSYRSQVREMILDFKIRGSWQVGCWLAGRMAADARVRDWLRDADAIMPAPSSFWSRWQGRFDLAHLMAEALSQELNCPLVSPPWQSFLRFQKQAFLSRLQRKSRSKGREPLTQGTWDLARKGSYSPNMTIVLVDDIVSTANTLTGIARRFRNGRFKFLTIASAYSVEASYKTTESKYDCIAAP